MKQILFVVLFAALLLSGCAQPGESPEQMIAEAKALDQRFVEAYNKGDVDAIMDTYWNSPDLVSYPPAELQLRGWEAVKQGMTKEFATMAGGKLELLETSYKAFGDVVISWGTWRYSMSEPPMEVVGRYSDVKGKKDGKWVYIMDHASAPMPPPTAEGTES